MGCGAQMNEADNSLCCTDLPEASTCQAKPCPGYGSSLEDLGRTLPWFLCCGTEGLQPRATLALPSAFPSSLPQ